VFLVQHRQVVTDAVDHPARALLEGKQVHPPVWALPVVEIIGLIGHDFSSPGVAGASSGTSRRIMNV
jgi:hypothetical protein